VRYDVIHKTRYDYDTAVSVSQHLLRLTPRPLVHQRSVHHEIAIEPKPALSNVRQDYLGNTVTFIAVETPHRALEVTAQTVVEVESPAPVEAARTPPWEEIRALCRGDGWTAAGASGQFAFPSPLIPRGAEFEQYARPSFSRACPVLEGAQELMARIHADFAFDPRATTVATPLGEVFRKRRGVCQDFAHLYIACLRALGLPARYVSGYLETLPPPGKPKLVGADASHAWASLWCGAEAGWVDLDPTNNVRPADRHITLGWGRDFGEVSPVRGVIVGGGRHRLKVAVDVTAAA